MDIVANKNNDIKCMYKNTQIGPKPLNPRVHDYQLSYFDNLIPGG